MAAKYDLVPKPNEKGDGKPQPLYPRVVSSGTIDTETIVRDISQASSFTPGDIEGVLECYERQVAHYLSEGYHVQIGRLGYLSPKLTARPVMDKKEIRANSISFNGANFRTSSWLLRHISGFLERAAHGFSHSSTLSLARRRQLLEEYLDNHVYITRTQYSELTGLLKNLALNDLNAWLKEGILDWEGRGSHKIYLRKQKPE